MRMFRITLEPSAQDNSILIEIFEKLSTYNNLLSHYPEDRREQMMYNHVRDVLIENNRTHHDFPLNYGRGQYHFWIAGLFNGLQNERFILIELPKNI